MGGRKIATSTDGVTWSDASLSNVNDLSSIVYGGDKFVIGAADGKLGTSPDGSSWSQITTPVFFSNTNILGIIL